MDDDDRIIEGVYLKLPILCAVSQKERSEDNREELVLRIFMSNFRHVFSLLLLYGHIACFFFTHLGD